MAITVIGVFDNPTEAGQAIEKLYNQGFPRESIQMTESGASENAEEEQKGGVSNFFKNLFGKEENTDNYVRVARYSETIVTVNVVTKAEAEVAADILRQCGVVNIDHYAEPEPEEVQTLPEIAPSASEALVTQKPVDVSTTDWNDPPVKTTRIAVMGENLKPVKGEVLADGLRLKSRMIEQQEQRSFNDGDDTDIIPQNKSERPIKANAFSNFYPGEIELVEKSEVPIISKEARVVEEVTVGKEGRERTTTISDTERKTEIKVEEG